MQRILVLGCPGSGKSTMARLLAARMDLPLIHLDRIYWSRGWVEPDPGAWKAKVVEAVAGPRWIVDGSYGGTLTERLAAADGAILLDFPRWLCVWRVVIRALLGWGRCRPDMAEGCPERLRWSFLTYIWNFRGAKRPNIAAELRRFPGRLIILRNPAEVRRWLDSEDVQMGDLPRVPA